MFNWLFGGDGIATKIIDKLVSGEKRQRLVMAILAGIAVYFLATYLAVPAQNYMLGSVAGVDALVFSVAAIALLVAIVIAWYNFARWISDTDERTDDEILIEATRDANIHTHSIDKK